MEYKISQQEGMSNEVVISPVFSLITVFNENIILGHEMNLYFFELKSSRFISNLTLDTKVLSVSQTDFNHLLIVMEDGRLRIVRYSDKKVTFDYQFENPINDLTRVPQFSYYAVATADNLYFITGTSSRLKISHMKGLFRRNTDVKSVIHASAKYLICTAGRAGMGVIIDKSKKQIRSKVEGIDRLFPFNSWMPYFWSISKNHLNYFDVNTLQSTKIGIRLYLAHILVLQPKIVNG